MNISSRTPEGEPALCPVCGTHVQVEPSLVYGDAPCPACGSLLWFLKLGPQVLVFRPSHQSRRKELARFLAERLGGGESQVGAHIESLGSDDLDSLELVELILELEESPE
jgi:hypothetical protein